MAQSLHFPWRARHVGNVYACGKKQKSLGMRIPEE
jgi:hypothetical protein